MSYSDKFWLGVNTTVISMGIVFIVLIALSYIIVIQSKILKLLTKNKEEGVAPTPKAPVISPAVENIKQGKTQGSVSVVGEVDEELAAVIMAAVSQMTNIPLSSLKIKSIKSLDGQWAMAAKQEQMR